MADAGATVPAKVFAWDGPTRLFKWGLVVCVASAYLSDEFGGATPAWHVINGQIVLILVVFRLLWGIVGGSTARFANFLAMPGEVVRYGRDVLGGRNVRYLGHNPLGGWMVVALIGLSAVMGLSGLFNADGDRLIIEGPLSAGLSDAAVHVAHRIHHQAFQILLACIVLHVAAVVFHSVVKKERLVPAMVTGKKSAAAYVDRAPATPGSVVAAAICLAAAVVIVWGGIALAK